MTRLESILVNFNHHSGAEALRKLVELVGTQEIIGFVLDYEYTKGHEDCRNGCSATTHQTFLAP